MIGATSLANVGAAGGAPDGDCALTLNDASAATPMAINARRFMGDPLVPGSEVPGFRGSDVSPPGILVYLGAPAAHDATASTAEVTLMRLTLSLISKPRITTV